MLSSTLAGVGNSANRWRLPTIRAVSEGNLADGLFLLCPGHNWLDVLMASLDIMQHIPDSKVHTANMGPTWVLSAPGGPHVGLMNLALWWNKPLCILCLSIPDSHYVRKLHRPYFTSLSKFGTAGPIIYAYIYIYIHNIYIYTYFVTISTCQENPINQRTMCVAHLNTLLWQRSKY